MAETTEGPPLWGVRKTIAVMLPMALVGWLVWFTYFASQDTKMKLSKAKGGECIVLKEPLPESGSVQSLLRKRECSKTHNAEIYARFEYPGSPGADQPTPEENCRRTPDGATAEQDAFYQRLLGALDDSDSTLLLLTNNPSAAEDREYVCVVAFPERSGSYLGDLAATLSPPTTT